MLRTRGNWVVLRLIERAAAKHGSIVIPLTQDQYTEAEVIAVGPGTVSAAGGRPDTHDLKPGQLVFVQHKKQVAAHQMAYAGIPYRKDGLTYFIFDESSIVGVVADTAEGAALGYTEITDGPALAKPVKNIVLN